MGTRSDDRQRLAGFVLHGWPRDVVVGRYFIVLVDVWVLQIVLSICLVGWTEKQCGWRERKSDSCSRIEAN